MPDLVLILLGFIMGCIVMQFFHEKPGFKKSEPELIKKHRKEDKELKVIKWEYELGRIPFDKFEEQVESVLKYGDRYAIAERKFHQMIYGSQRVKR